MKTIVIIPARAGSKRLPGKNTRILGNIPLVMHSIRYALENNNIIDKIYLTTDDEKIKNMCRSEKILIVDRPPQLTTDVSTTVSALKHVLENLKEEVENVILLQPTNPLRPVNLLKEALDRYIKGYYNSLITVTRSYHKFGKIENDCFYPFNYKIGQRSQDLDPLYFENGLLYITKASLIKEGKIMGDKNFPFIVDHPFANIDIDNEEDLEYAEFLLNRRKL